MTYKEVFTHLLNTLGELEGVADPISYGLEGTQYFDQRGAYGAYPRAFVSIEADTAFNDTRAEIGFDVYILGKGVDSRQGLVDQLEITYNLCLALMSKLKGAYRQDSSKPKLLDGWEVQPVPLVREGANVEVGWQITVTFEGNTNLKGC